MRNKQNRRWVGSTARHEAWKSNISGCRCGPCPRIDATRLDPQPFRMWLCRRFFLLLLSSHTCQAAFLSCMAIVQRVRGLGCWESWGSLERAAAQVCREAGLTDLFVIWTSGRVTAAYVRQLSLLEQRPVPSVMEDVPSVHKVLASLFFDCESLVIFSQAFCRTKRICQTWVEQLNQRSCLAHIVKQVHSDCARSIESARADVFPLSRPVKDDYHLCEKEKTFWSECANLVLRGGKHTIEHPEGTKYGCVKFHSSPRSVLSNLAGLLVQTFVGG